MLENTQKMIKSWQEELEDAIGHRVHIPIKGLVTEEPVTVYSLDYDIIANCNHAGHYEASVTEYAGLDNEREVKVEVCDKCLAVMNEVGEWS